MTNFVLSNYHIRKVLIVLPWFSLAQLGLALLTLALVPLMELSQAIKALAGLCQLQLAYDLAMVLFIIHI